MMRILIISGAFPPMKCGVGDYTYHLAQHLAKEKKTEVIVITSVNSNHQNIKNFTVLPIVEKWSINSLNSILKRVKELKPDLVHVQYPTVGYDRFLMPSFLPISLRLIGIKNIVQTWHEPLSKKGLIRYFPNAITSTPLIFVEEEYTKKLPYFYRKLLKNNTKNFVPISSNIQQSSLDESEKQNLKERIFKQGLKQNIIAYFGFVTPKKGIEYLLDSADPEKDNLLLLCELVEEDPYHVSLKEKIENSKWKDRVIITGYLNEKEVADYLSIADMAVFPFIDGASIRNGSILAALLQQTFVITTSLKENGLSNQKDIYFVPPKDSEGLREAIDLFRGRTKQELSQGVITWTSIAKEHLKVYESTFQN
jgi:glycosyltransferase involved in cell wall biosynthesis